ncbi:MAG: NAD+ synthase [Planctomycetota bacterium]
MRIGIAQINTRIGDVAGNTERISEAGRLAGLDLLVTPEMAVCGYTPRDLFENPSFLEEVEKANERLIRGATSPLLFGTVWREGGGLVNGAMLAAGGTLVGRQAKRLLPNYDVFDELRYFRAGHASEPLSLGGARIGVSICEDAWTDRILWPECPHTQDPLSDLVRNGATHLVNLSASPYSMGRPPFRERLFAERARQLNRPLTLANLVGGQDELLFDGGSLQCDSAGRVTGRAPLFSEHVGALDGGVTWPEGMALLLRALTTGLRDFVVKSGQSKVLVGLSGGIDSALVLSLAVLALGPSNVTAMAMPGPFSSPDSLDDARSLAKGLEVEFLVCPIGAVFNQVLKTLKEEVNLELKDLAHQNAQARTRGHLLMAVSNARGALVLGTGNKSELAAGYCTMYGDLIGALAPIGDLTKGFVRALSRHLRDAGLSPIPERTLSRDPSAELAPGQRDEDNLPRYEHLDALVEAHVLHPGDRQALASVPMTAADSGRWVEYIEAMEFKRRQSPPILRVTSRAFGLGRRYPLTLPKARP